MASGLSRSSPRSWEEARTLIDAYLKGEGGVGQTAGFKAVLSELPDRASFLLLFSTQALVRMMRQPVRDDREERRT